MRQLNKRVEALEDAKQSGQIGQVVLWAHGIPFEDALSRAGGLRPDGLPRMLITLVGVKGGHGKPIEEDWRPEYQAEYDKARAWAAG
ncbi:hypothetical protein A8B75_11630 [Sphingomonadales bacterium EhC05]|nr:hypothetical protein A8B75_11630 [Sphingomonadales bacterium EhC05]